MICLEDQIGNVLRFEKTPQRIVCLVPSLTELLFDLSLEESLVGRTKFCIYPEGKVDSIAKVGGTKTPDIEKIRSLSPDLIIANKEENNQADIVALQKISTVYVSDIIELKDNSAVIRDIGTICNCPDQSDLLNQTINHNFRVFDDRGIPQTPIDVAYLIWKDPYMVAGSDNFINSILKKINLRNIYAENADRYPKIQLEDLKNKQNTIILLSNEPFPFSEKHLSEIRLLVENTPTAFVDATYFSWYGSRMAHAPEYLLTLRNRIMEIVNAHKA